MLQNSPQTWPTPSTLSPTPSKQKQESEMSSSLFTVAQWQELEHQALIFKYLKSGFPVPPDLLVPIRRSFQLMSPSFFCQPTSLGYCSYIGKKIDPEPGRCRRTDGKKWRCSQEAHPDSKYCERHMNRGRYRSRKLVELRTTASKSLSTVPSEAANGSSSSTGSFQKTPLQSEANCKFLCFGGNVTQLQDDSLHYGTSNNGHRGLRRMTLDLGKDNFLPEASGSMRCDGTDTGFDSSWHFAASQIPFSSSSEPISSSLMLSNNQQQRFQDIEPPNVDSLPSKQEQHCFFGKELGVPVSVKQEHNMLQPLFNQWSETKDLGSYPENHRSSKDLLTTTQLSMSSATSDFFTRNDQSHSDAYR